MNIVLADFEPLPYEYGEELKHIERCGRLAYKSENLISEDDSSAKKFVKMLVDRGHLAVIEHASLAYEISAKTYKKLTALINEFESTLGLKCFLRLTHDRTLLANDKWFNRYIISGNLRAWRSFLSFFGGINFAFINNLSEDDDLFVDICRLPEVFNDFPTNVTRTQTKKMFTHVDPSSLSKFEQGTHRDITIKIICDRGVSHEIVRHRIASYVQESTRYCNYSLDKFDKNVRFIDIKPGIMIEKNPSLSETEKVRSAIYREWEAAIADAEKHYLKMIELGASPQIARSVLPNSTKTEIAVTMNLNEWKWFFHLRTDPKAHPQMREIAVPIQAYFTNVLKVL